MGAPPGVVLDSAPLSAPPPGVTLDTAAAAIPAGVVLDSTPAPAPPAGVTLDHSAATISAYTPSFWDRLKQTVEEPFEQRQRAMAESVPSVSNDGQVIEPKTHFDERLLAPEQLIPANDQGTTASVARGALRAAGGLTSPGSLAMVAIPGAEVLGLGDAGSAVLSRLIAAGFSGQQVVSIAKEVPHLRTLIKNGDTSGAAQMLGAMGVGALGAALGAAHASRMLHGASATDAEADEAPATAAPSAGAPSATAGESQPTAETIAPRPGARPAGDSIPPSATNEDAQRIGDDSRTPAAAPGTPVPAEAAPSAAQGGVGPSVYAASKAKLAPKLATPTTQLDPAAQANATRVGLFHLQNGSADYDTWAKSMTQDLGPSVEPHLKTIWRNVKRRAAMDKFAGNINLGKLQTSDDVKDAIKNAAASMPDELREATRGTVPLGDTEATAQQMVRDGIIKPEDVANVTKGTAWNAEQLNAARAVFTSAAEQAHDAQVAWQQNRTDENLVRFRALTERAGALQKSVAGLTAEAGRALQSFRIAARAAQSKSGIELALDQLGGRNLSEQAARDLAAIPDGDQIALAKFLRSQNNWTVADKLRAYWTASLLSSPKTMAAKTVGDAMMAALDPSVRLVRGASDAAFSTVLGRPRQYYAGEAAPAFVAWVHGLSDGFQKGLQVMQHGYHAEQAENVVSGLEAPRYELFGGSRNPMNWGPRYLEGVTEMMKTAATRAELSAGAYRLARQEGLRGTPLRQRMANILVNPPDELVNDAAEFGKRQTFINRSDGLAVLQRFIDNFGHVKEGPFAGLRPVRFFIPFARVPYNIFARGLELTPAGLAAGIAKGNADLTARGLIGSTVLATAAGWAANGYLTGAAPKIPKDRAAFYASGKQPYSIKVGNHWISYERNFGVLGMPLAVAAAFKSRYDREGKVPGPDELTQGFGQLIDYFSNLPFVTGINAIANAMETPEASLPGMVGSILSGFVPGSAALRDVAHLEDPRSREQRVETGGNFGMADLREIYNRVAAGLPVAQESLPLRHDAFGRVVVNRADEGPLNAVLPSPAVSAAPVSPADAETAKLGVYPGAVQHEMYVNNQRILLKPREAEQYQQLIGKAQLKAAQRAMGSPGYWNMSDEQRALVMKGAMAGARRIAEARFRNQLRGRR